MIRLGTKRLVPRQMISKCAKIVFHRLDTIKDTQDDSMKSY